MTGMTNIDELPIEPVTQMLVSAFEDCESALIAIEDRWKQLENFGQLLTRAKQLIPYGQWDSYIEKTFKGKLKPRTVRRWMLEYREPEKAEERREKSREAKRPSVAEVAKASVEVIEPGRQSVQPDDDSAPAKPTNRKVTASTKKTKEADKPKTAAITPEIIATPAAEHWNPITLADYSDDELLDTIDARASEPKKTAKKYRKRADVLDPPDTDRAPTLTQLINAIPDDWNPDLINAAADWCRYKASRPKAERYSTLKGWQITLKHMSEGKPKDVITKIEKAISNNWKGWDHANGQNSKSRTGLTGDDW